MVGLDDGGEHREAVGRVERAVVVVVVDTGQLLRHKHRITNTNARKEGRVLFNDTLNTTNGRKEMFYLTTHSTHFIYGHMASNIW